jgi:peptide/nickel transport system permease protein
VTVRVATSDLVLTAAPARAAVRASPRLWVGTACMGVALAAALLSLAWTPYAPDALDVQNRLAGSSGAHWLGTDAFGRDVASRLLEGARHALWVGAFAVAIGVLIGGAIGLAAAASTRWLDEAIARAADLLFAFPAVLTAILLAILLGPGLLTATLAIGIFNVPVFARLVRSAAGAVWAQEFVRAAEAIGKERCCIALHHVLPNILGLVLVQASASFAIAILAEAALSYLGLGIQAPAASWGRMLFEARTYLDQAPALAIFPGLAIAVVVFGANLLGDALRDSLDPRRNQ